jgi:ATP-binding cassette subfamily B protein
MPLIAFLTQRLSRELHQRFESLQAVFSRIMEKVRESLVGILVVKAYTLEEREVKKLENLSLEYQTLNLGLAKISGALFPLSLLFTNLSLVLVLWIGGGKVLTAEITAGDFVAFISYLGILGWPVMALGWVINLLKRGAVSLGRIQRVLEAVPEIQDLPQARPLPAPMDSIRIKELTFTYPGAESPVLKALSLELKANREVLITGRTGSGKTTLAHLLPRLLESPDNTIFLDGREIHHLPLAQLRTLISLIPQDPFLFSDTVRANLLLSGPEAGERELWEILDAAALKDEVENFSQRLDTVIGEKGVLLSGGQKQRLALARALLADPPVLILDNTLAAVDQATEIRILNNIRNLRSGKATIYISHRLLNFTSVDVIYLLEKGSLTEAGRHQELLKKDGLYAQLFRHQNLEEELRRGEF